MWGSDLDDLHTVTNPLEQTEYLELPCVMSCCCSCRSKTKARSTGYQTDNDISLVCLLIVCVYVWMLFSEPCQHGRGEADSQGRRGGESRGQRRDEVPDNPTGRCGYQWRGCFATFQKFGGSGSPVLDDFYRQEQVVPNRRCECKRPPYGGPLHERICVHLAARRIYSCHRYR